MHKKQYFNFDNNLRLANPKLRVYLLKDVQIDSFHPFFFFLELGVYSLLYEQQVT